MRILLSDYNKLLLIIKTYKLMNKIKLVIPVLLLLFVTNNTTFAYPGGVSGYTLKTNSNGCGSCHSTHGSLTSSINVVISGPTTLKPNQVGTYKVTISGGSGTKVGVDIACSAGTLSKSDANLKVLNTELTQSSAKTFSSGSYIFNFTYQAPADTGYKTLYATGMSKKSQWNFGTNFLVHVQLLSGVDDNTETIVKDFSLSQNYPNPFNPSTQINYNLNESGQVLLKVYDSIGNLVTTLVDEYKSAGNYSANFNTASLNYKLSSGIYFYTINIKSANKSFTETKKALLLK